MNVHSYSKIYNLGHPAIATLFDTPVVLQEKIDGSQISWMWDTDGQLTVKSKGQVQYGPERLEPDKMFEGAVKYLLSQPEQVIATAIGHRSDAIVTGLSPFIFRGEYLSKPKHNTIAYDRVPRNGLMLFDIEFEPYVFASRIAVINWAEYLGIEAVPQWSGDNVDLERLKILLDEESVLGGHKIEGIVIKAYDQFTRDGKVMMGKYVSEAFKEKHQRSWDGRNPSKTDVVQEIINSLNTDPRWHKAIQHLRDDGMLEGSPRDIGPLMKELKRDVLDEEGEWIRSKLWEHFHKQIIRGIGRGFPEFYKALLAEGQFDE